MSMSRRSAAMMRPSEPFSYTGAGGNAAAMRPFAAHIAALGIQVVLADLPGYGLTHPAHDPDVTYGDSAGAPPRTDRSDR